MLIFEDVRMFRAEHRHLPHLVKLLNSMAVPRIRESKTYTTIDEQNSNLSKLKLGHNDLFVGQIGSNVIGFITVKRTNNLENIIALASYVSNMDISSEYKMLRAVVEYCIMEVGANKVVINILAGDMALIKTAEALGFRSEVRRRQAYFSLGKFNHILEYGLLASEWLLQDKREK